MCHIFEKVYPRSPFFSLAFLLILILIVPETVLGQDRQKRSSIHAMDGCAYLSENMSLTMNRDAALRILWQEYLDILKINLQNTLVILR